MTNEEYIAANAAMINQLRTLSELLDKVVKEQTKVAEACKAASSSVETIIEHIKNG